MAILLDTGILYAYYDRSDSWHDATLELFKRGAEVDYFLSQRVGQAAQRAFYEGMIESDYFVVDLSSTGYSRVLELNWQYADLELGFVDAAIIAIAEDLDLGRIATTDRRHFGAVKATVPLSLLP